MAVKLKITLRKSPIGYDSSHRATARALGFTKLQQVRVHDDNKVIRGMVHKIRHLVYVEQVLEEQA